MEKHNLPQKKPPSIPAAMHVGQRRFVGFLHDVDSHRLWKGTGPLAREGAPLSPHVTRFDEGIEISQERHEMVGGAWSTPPEAREHHDRVMFLDVVIG